ncbi:hypothetical protein ACFQVD_34555 [Streptosporangium amethystogenes subsp. fukuiense]|uniref:Uncharacterized protein n=1 Tax=Streptosporangium amethystogenes subsp. fukuiense TaxID=698418 RepID=A0ABW2T953_9ACTN
MDTTNKVTEPELGGKTPERRKIGKLSVEKFIELRDTRATDAVRARLR